MTHRKFCSAPLATAAFSALIAASCAGGGGGGSGMIVRPVDIRASSMDLEFRGRTTRFVYVANLGAGTVSVIDQVSESIVDTDGGDDFDYTPLSVGGEPVALAVVDREGGPRVFVADRAHRQVLAFDASADGGGEVLLHTPVDLGGERVVKATRPVFRDSGRASSPVLSDITLDPAEARSEFFEVKFGGSSYKVRGSVSGEQIARAYEGERYTTDDGALSFLIRGGGERTTKDDRFRFGVVVARPLTVAGVPVDLQTDGSYLFVVTSDPPQVVVADVETGEVERIVALEDGEGGDVIPGRAVIDGDRLVVSNLASDRVAIVSLSDWAASGMDAGEPSLAVGVAGGVLFSVAQRARVLRVLTGPSALEILPLSDFGLCLAGVAVSGRDLALVGTVTGAVNVLDADTLTRVDAVVRKGERESGAFGMEFFDVDPPSAPELIAVNTKDGVTRTERWQLTYEGVLPGAARLDCVIDGDILTCEEADFTASFVEEGDAVVFNPQGVSEEESVGAVMSETELRLVRAPTLQGEATAEVRMSGAYLAFGSTSGPQRSRVPDGEAYRSDDGAVALTIRPDRFRPTTRGDFFTFVTIEADEPIPVSDSSFAGGVAAFTRPGETVPTAYLANTGSNSVSILDLRSLRERRILR